MNPLIIPRRMTARVDGDFVVFLIGARLNTWWKLNQFKWVGDAMKAMITEVEQRGTQVGFLGHESFVTLPSTIMIQYWRSSEQLIAYARNRDATHYPAWVQFNREIAKRHDIGIWHETYVIKAGSYECVYNNMPRFGLGKAAESLAAEGAHASAHGRLGQTDGGDAPVTPDGVERT